MAFYLDGVVSTALAAWGLVSPKLPKTFKGLRDQRN